MGTLRKLKKSVTRELNYIEKKILRPIGDVIQNVASDPKKLIGVALSVAFPGAGSAIGSALGLTGTAASIVGQTVINTALNGGDVKSAVISAAIPIVGKEVAGTIGTTLDSSNISGTVNDIITRGAAQGATAAILGKDPAAAFLMGGVSAGVGAITSGIPEFSSLPQPAQNAINAALGTRLLGGNVAGAVSDTAINDAMSWARNEINKAPNAINDARVLYNSKTGKSLSDDQIEDLLKSGGVEGLRNSVEKLSLSEMGEQPSWQGPVGPPASPEQLKAEQEEYDRFMGWLKTGQQTPDYSPQNLQIPKESWDSFNNNLLQMQNEGRLPSQWSPGNNGSFTYKDDYGSTITIDSSGNVIGSTPAPKGSLPGETPAPSGRPTILGAPQGQQMQDLLVSQFPQLAQTSQVAYEPIYGKGVDYFDPFAPLDVNYLGNRDENQGSQPGQQATKISSGGYMDDLIRILKG